MLQLNHSQGLISIARSSDLGSMHATVVATFIVGTLSGVELYPLSGNFSLCQCRSGAEFNHASFGLNLAIAGIRE